MKYPPVDAATHLDATMRWLCVAQDATPDGGVSRMYHLEYGWGASYPETTGYIIPTFLDYARLSGDQSYRERALRMADWEIGIQMPSGAVQGGTIADRPSPAIFNTGQVLFGWVSAFRETGDERYRKALTAAADYLCRIQDADGAWRRELSRFVSASTDTYAYNIRTAWALLLAAAATGRADYRDAAARKLAFTVGLAQPNGWIAKNCLNDTERPLLHTIAYSLQGILECSAILGDARSRDVVTTACGHLAVSFYKNGGLAGRYDEHWNPAVRYRCLTGEAQLGIILWRLADLTGDAQWSEMARALNDQLRRTQQLNGAAETAGGVKGSYPVSAEYGQYQYLNWAAKFFADSLMCEMRVTGAGTSG